MVASLRSLLEKVIDYAGLFPPAELDMPHAVAEYLRTVQGSDSWIVSRFACPSTHLAELSAALQRSPGLHEIPVTVIGKPSSSLDDWYESLEQDADLMNEFVGATSDVAAIEAYEIRVPSNHHIGSCINDLKAFEEIEVFVELPWGAGLDDSLAALAESDWLCAKARTGGQTPAAFPPASELAEFLHGAIALDLRFKMTAGLHHPLPRVDKDSGARMHGFVNVLAACCLGLSEDMSRSEIEDVLLTTAIRDWRFEEGELLWRDSRVTIEDIEESRDLFWSIGSCSVEDALTDLDALGLITGGR